MPTPIDWPRWRLYQRTIEGCFREGFSPRGQAGGKGSALAEAERRLTAAGKLIVGPKTNATLARWLGAQERRAKRGLDHCLPAVGLYRPLAAVRVAASSRAVERYVLTSAQNDTPVHNPFWSNLKAYAAYIGARLMVGRFTYQVGAVKERARKSGSDAERDRRHAWAQEFGDALTSERVGLGDLVFAAEMNTLPTAARPLSGLETYGQGRTAIFPHAKIALNTVAVGGDATPPCILTTGAATVPSYSDTKAGHKGEFHHVPGAVVVEVDDGARTFFRHIVARIDGSFQDLDLAAANGKISAGQRVEAITFGDLQLPFLDPSVAAATWGIDASTLESVASADVMVDALKPRYGFFHDTNDFKAISHHELNKARERFRTFVRGQHMIEPALRHAADFLRRTSRAEMASVLIESNHDRWLERWLDEADHRKDRPNALAFLRWNTARYEAEARGEDDFNVLRHALTEAGGGALECEIVPEGGSYVICQAAGGVDCGAHGHLGPNGASASPTALARAAGKANIGDKHSPAIVDGLYVAGTSSLLRLGYNKGPSSWRHAHIITYPNGKRTLVFLQDGRWRA